MNASGLKAILNSLVVKSDQDFTVEIQPKPNRIKTITARYHASEKRIVIFRKPNDTLNVLGSGIHELAHHLCRKHHGIRKHGKVYRRTLDVLVRIFNQQYSKKIGLRVTWDKRRPSMGTFKWANLEKTEHHGNIDMKREGGDSHGTD